MEQTFNNKNIYYRHPWVGLPEKSAWGSLTYLELGTNRSYVHVEVGGSSTVPKDLTHALCLRVSLLVTIVLVPSFSFVCMSQRMSGIMENRENKKGAVPHAFDFLIHSIHPANTAVPEVILLYQAVISLPSPETASDNHRTNNMPWRST